MKLAFVVTIAALAVAHGGLDARQALAPANCGNPANARPFYRLYSSAAVDHFYTLSATEANAATDLGYRREGISSYIFPNRRTPGTVPLYRLYSAAATDHFYTTSAAERSSAVGLGYTPEGIAGYIYPNNECGGVPLYRLYSASGTDHFYTTSAAERDSAVRGGYTSEGITGYVFPY